MSICAKCGGVVSPKELYVAWQQLIFNITKAGGGAICATSWIYNWYDFKRVALESGWDYGDGVVLCNNNIKIIKKEGGINETNK